MHSSLLSLITNLSQLCSFQLVNELGLFVVVVVVVHVGVLEVMHLALIGILADAQLGAGNSGGLLVEELLDELGQVILNEARAGSCQFLAREQAAEGLELLKNLLLGVLGIDVALSKANQELANLAFLKVCAPTTTTTIPGRKNSLDFFFQDLTLLLGSNIGI